MQKSIKSSAAKKPTAKKAVRGESTVKRAASKASSLSSRTRASIEIKPRPSKSLSVSIPSGYKESPNGLIVPEAVGKTVSPTKFAKGLQSAKSAIQETIKEFSDFMTQDMEVSEIELSVSINAKGEFMGFGIGGDASVKI